MNTESNCATRILKATTYKKLNSLIAKTLRNWKNITSETIYFTKEIPSIFYLIFHSFPRNLTWKVFE